MAALGTTDQAAPERRRRRYVGRDYAGTPGFTGGAGRRAYLYDPAEVNSTWRDLRARVARIREMLTRCSTIALAVEARTLPIVLDEWRFVAPAQASAEEQQAAAWLTRVFVTDPHTPWSSLLRWALSAIPYGFAVIEGRFALVDGRITPVGWEPRSQYSVADSGAPWDYDADGVLVRVRQSAQSTVGGRRPEPMEARHLIHATYRPDGNPEGSSLLRALHKDELMVHVAEELEGIAVERFACPSPVANMDDNAAIDGPQLEELRDAMAAYQGMHESYLLGLPGVSFDTLGASSGDRIDTGPIIERWRQLIAISLGVPFAMLGTGNSTGSYALSDTQFDQFSLVLEADARWLATQIQPMVDRLVRINFGAQLRTPQLTPQSFLRADTQERLKAIAEMLVSGAIPRTEAIVRHLAEGMSLPLPPPEIPLLPAMQEAA